MIYKITNISGTVIGLLVNTKKGGYQYNLYKGKSVKITRLTEQIRNLADPSKGQLILEKEE
nr:MAG TPA: hypothetical protein [Caudoviricetes sp.]